MKENIHINLRDPEYWKQMWETAKGLKSNVWKGHSPGLIKGGDGPFDLICH